MYRHYFEDSRPRRDRTGIPSRCGDYVQFRYLSNPGISSVVRANLKRHLASLLRRTEFLARHSDWTRSFLAVTHAERLHDFTGRRAAVHSRVTPATYLRNSRTPPGALNNDWPFI